MGWFKSVAKPSVQYLADPTHFRFASLYKHNIDLAIASFGYSQAFRLSNSQSMWRSLGDAEAVGIVHFDIDGPLIPFQLSIGASALDESDEVGRFHVEQIKPYHHPDFPEDRKSSFLQLGIHITDTSGAVRAALEKAMDEAAISQKNFLHARLLKDASDPAPMVGQIREQEYCESRPIKEFVIRTGIRLRAPSWSTRWQDD